jgi:hypothetical protein
VVLALEFPLILVLLLSPAAIVVIGRYSGPGDEMSNQKASTVFSPRYCSGLLSFYRSLVRRPVAATINS